MYVATQLNQLGFKEGHMCSHAQKSVIFPKSFCKSCTCMLPVNSVSRRLCVRSFAVNAPTEVGGKQPERHVTFDVLSQNNSQRSSTDLEGQLQQLFDAIMSIVKLGKKDEAIDLLKANYEAVKEQVDSGTAGTEEAAVLDVVLLGYMAIGDLQTVGSLMDEEIRARSFAHHCWDWLNLSALAAKLLRHWKYISKLLKFQNLAKESTVKS